MVTMQLMPTDGHGMRACVYKLCYFFVFCFVFCFSSFSLSVLHLRLLLLSDLITLASVSLIRSLVSPAARLRQNRIVQCFSLSLFFIWRASVYI